jgi:hypothetical protein
MLFVFCESFNMMRCLIEVIVPDLHNNVSFVSSIILYINLQL